MTDQLTSPYPYPVNRLLNLGLPRARKEWPVYLTMGLTAAHIPDLIRMVLDDQLNEADGDSREVWAPIHAWRALGQLRAVEAIEPLLTLLQRIDADDDDWIGEEIPRVFSMIGQAAMPALSVYLAEAAHGMFARIAAAYSLEWIARRYTTLRDQSIFSLSQQLEKFDENDPTLNGFLISYLIDLKAVESAQVIEQAFAANRVDLDIMGDWEDAQIELGLKSKRETPRPRLNKKLQVIADTVDQWQRNLQKKR